jgi:hypothetical protein
MLNQVRFVLVISLVFFWYYVNKVSASKGTVNTGFNIIKECGEKCKWVFVIVNARITSLPYRKCRHRMTVHRRRGLCHGMVGCAVLHPPYLLSTINILTKTCRI